MAQKKGGELISKVFLGTEFPLEFKCSKGHIWKVTPERIKYGSWCRKCSVRNFDLTISDINKIAEAKGGKCLSTEYKGTGSKYKCQ